MTRTVALALAVALVGSAIALELVPVVSPTAAQAAARR